MIGSYTPYTSFKSLHHRKRGPFTVNVIGDFRKPRKEPNIGIVIKLDPWLPCTVPYIEKAAHDFVSLQYQKEDRAINRTIRLTHERRPFANEDMNDDKKILRYLLHLYFFIGHHLIFP